jgi:hypothetical protein
MKKLIVKVMLFYQKWKPTEQRLESHVSQNATSPDNDKNFRDKG